jgi:hypothetical protein
MARVVIGKTLTIDKRATIAAGLHLEDIEGTGGDHQALPYCQTQDASGLAVTAWMGFEHAHRLSRDDRVKRPADVGSQVLKGVADLRGGVLRPPSDCCCRCSLPDRTGRRHRVARAALGAEHRGIGPGGDGAENPGLRASGGG